MRRLKTTAIFIIILFALFTFSCSTESDAKRVSSDSTDQTEVSETADTVGDASNNNTQIDWSSYLLFLSLGLNLLVLTLVVIRHRSNLSERQVESIVKKVYDKRDQSIYRHNHNQFDTRSIENVVYRIVDSRAHTIANNLVNDKIRQIELASEREVRTQTEHTTIENVASNSYLYATAANRDNNTFYDVTSQPEPGSTIYALEVDGNRAKFGIFKAAYEKVLKENNFLECACEYQVVGSRTSVSTVKAGIAEKQPNGKWKIIKKAIIKFE